MILSEDRLGMADVGILAMKDEVREHYWKGESIVPLWKIGQYLSQRKSKIGVNFKITNNCLDVNA